MESRSSIPWAGLLEGGGEELGLCASVVRGKRGVRGPGWGRGWRACVCLCVCVDACSCLENPRDQGFWWAAVHGVAQRRARLKRFSSSSSSNGRMHARGRCFLYAVSSLKCWLTQAKRLQMNLGSACWGEIDFLCGVSVPASRVMGVGGGGRAGFWLEGRVRLELGSSAVSSKGMKAEPVPRVCVVERPP